MQGKISRIEIVRLRVSAEEKRKVEEAAQMLGKTVSEFVRECSTEIARLVAA